MEPLRPAPQAIGFDLFNTLLAIHPSAMAEAHTNIIQVLHEKGYDVDAKAFSRAYIEAAKGFIAETKKDGRETHNRYWIASALENLGHTVSAEDARIEAAVDAYFSAFYPHCELIPGTIEMLEALSGRFALGLLTNFTHPPAVRKIIDMLGLAPYFPIILISGDLGFRKPHPSVFRELISELGMAPEKIIYVGDDPEADIHGAGQAGLRPILTTAVRDQNIASAQTLLSPGPINCPPDVPRISKWEELHSLLHD